MTVLPFAYWHYKNGTLLKTISAKGTAPFYFFSPDHSEVYEKRLWKTDPLLDIPNSEDHVFKYNLKKWKKVPLKSQYKNDRFVYRKPLLVISNKYNLEWDNEPVNYLDLSTLKTLFKQLTPHYQIIYNRPHNTLITEDNSANFNLNDHEMIKETYPETINLQDLHFQNFDLTFNELQLKVYANCERFISVQGGNSVLCSYFEGTNIILAKRGLEIDFNEYYNLFHLYSGAEIVPVRNEKELVAQVRQVYKTT